MKNTLTLLGMAIVIAWGTITTSEKVMAQGVWNSGVTEIYQHQFLPASTFDFQPQPLVHNYVADLEQSLQMIEQAYQNHPMSISPESQREYVPAVSTPVYRNEGMERWRQQRIDDARREARRANEAQRRNPSAIGSMRVNTANRLYESSLRPW